MSEIHLGTRGPLGRRLSLRAAEAKVERASSWGGAPRNQRLGPQPCLAKNASAVSPVRRLQVLAADAAAHAEARST